MDINFSKTKNSFQNFNLKDSRAGKFVCENKKIIGVVALSTLCVGAAYASYNLYTASVTAEEACHNFLQNGLDEYDNLANGFTAEEYELTSAVFDKEALADTTQKKVYLTCVAKLTEKITDPYLKSFLPTDYNIVFDPVTKKNEMILVEKEFNVQINFLKA